MPIPERELGRLAEGILQQLVLLRTARFSKAIQRTSILIEQMKQLCTVSDRLGTCLERGWQAGAERCSQRIQKALADWPCQADELQHAVDSARKPLPRVQEILADLRQLQEEFPSCRYEKKAGHLLVTTEAIELQGHYLGEFDIQLRLGSIHERNHRSTYRVVALDPHPSGRNESVTHPHVSDQCLCEGDAGAAIAAALSSGRICDFFQLVNSVLTTYNPHSPYVSLEDWDGEPCHDCGTVIDADDTFWCHSCEEDFCESCASYCRNCEETTCASCLQTCVACNDSVCPSCMTTCDDCGRSICRSCRTDNQCPCVQEKENEDESTEKPAEGSPVQAQAA